MDPGLQQGGETITYLAERPPWHLQDPPGTARSYHHIPDCAPLLHSAAVTASSLPVCTSQALPLPHPDVPPAPTLGGARALPGARRVGTESPLISGHGQDSSPPRMREINREGLIGSREPQGSQGPAAAVASSATPSCCGLSRTAHAPRRVWQLRRAG